MFTFKCEDRFRFLSAAQRARLSATFLEPMELQPHILSHKLESQYSEALAVMFILSTTPVSEVFLLIYHRCDMNLPAIEYQLGEGKGFPNLPIRCPLCDDQIESEDEVAVDYMMRNYEAITFNWSTE